MFQLLAAAVLLAATAKAPAPKPTPKLQDARPITAPAAPAMPSANTPPSGAAAPSLVPGASIAPRLLSVATAESKLDFHVDHKLHKVLGTTKALEGKGALKPDGTLQIVVRAPISSFDSGDANRDSHMREVLEAPKFTHVTLKAATKLALPTSFPSSVDAVLDAELEFHGQKRRERIPVKLTFTKAGELRAVGGMTVSLDAYAIERPSLLMMKVEDACRIDFDVVVREATR